MFLSIVLLGGLPQISGRCIISPFPFLVQEINTLIDCPYVGRRPGRCVKASCYPWVPGSDRTSIRHVNLGEDWLAKIGGNEVGTIWVKERNPKSLSDLNNWGTFFFNE